jgi:hypothetical protein
MADMDEQDKEAIVEAAREGNLQEVRRLVQQDRQLLMLHGDVASKGRN